MSNPELKPCPKCGILPVKETRRKMLGKIRDGGYMVTEGRFRCQNCNCAPGWGKCYCVDYGWNANVEVWNKEVGDYERKNA